MSSFRLRPRFKQYADITQDDFLAKALELRQSQNKDFVLQSTHSYIVIKIPSEERNSWSPQLELEFEKQEGKTLIRGHYGPNPGTWMLFMYGYAVLGISFSFIGVWVMSKMTLGKPYGEIWYLALIAGLGLALYFGAQLGQKLGAEHMFRLHFFYQEVMKERVHIE
jgi:hypothetical protein